VGGLLEKLTIGLTQPSLAGTGAELGNDKWKRPQYDNIHICDLFYKGPL
jgi:hypothetical protein